MSPCCRARQSCLPHPLEGVANVSLLEERTIVVWQNGLSTGTDACVAQNTDWWRSSAIARKSRDRSSSVPDQTSIAEERGGGIGALRMLQARVRDNGRKPRGRQRLLMPERREGSACNRHRRPARSRAEA